MLRGFRPRFDRRGASKVEYGLLAGLLAVGAITAVDGVGGSVANLLGDSAGAVENAVAGIGDGAGADAAGAHPEPAPKEEQGGLPNCSPTPGGKFGYWLAAAGDVVVVGATGGDGNAAGSGVACLYSASSLTLQHVLAPAGSGSGDQVGTGVSVGGGYAVLGAPWTASNAGRAYVHTTSDGQLRHTLQGADTLAGDDFGRTTATDGTHVVVGAPTDDNAQGTDAGAAYVFNASSGQQTHKLLPADQNGEEQFGMRFGRSVAIDDGVIAVGAWRDSVGGIADAGSVYLFDADTGAQLRKITAARAEGLSLGFDVDLDDGLLVASAHNQTDGAGNRAGAAHVYDVATGALVEEITRTGSSDFGQSLAMDAGTLVAADPSANGAEGEVHVYDLARREFVQTLAPDVDLFSAYFGRGVDVSGGAVVGGAPSYYYSSGAYGGAWVFR